MQQQGLPIGSVQPAQQKRLNSLAILKQVLASRHRLRSRVWCCGLALVAALAIPASLGETIHTLTSLLTCLLCLLLLLRSCCSKLMSGSTPSLSSLVGGTLAWIVCGLTPTFLSAAFAYNQPPSQQIAASLLLFVPGVLAFYAATWMLQLFPFVACIEGRGWHHDMLRAFRLLRGNSVELLAAVLAISIRFYFLTMIGAIALALFAGLPLVAFSQWAHIEFPISPKIAVPAAFCGFVWIWVSESSAALLNLYLYAYWEFRSRIETIPNHQCLVSDQRAC